MVVEQLKALETPTADTVAMELKPYNTLLDEDITTSLLSLIQEKLTGENIVSALLGDLRVELEEGKKRALSIEDLETALTMKQAAAVVARLQSSPSPAPDVLLCLQEYKGVISEEWHVRMHSLVPSFSPECGPSSKRMRPV